MLTGPRRAQITATVRRSARVLGLCVVCSAAFALGAPAAHALPDDPPAEPPAQPPADESRIVPVPPGCAAPDNADLVFVGTAIGVDHVDEFVRFRIDQLRAGSASPYAIDGLIDIRYGDDFRFIDEDQQYLVGARLDPEYGRLASTVRPPAPLFGGNDVIGLEEASVECPEFEDPVRTLHIDGTSVDSGVLSLLFEDRRLLAATVLIPTAIAFAALIALVVIRMVWGVAFKGVIGLGRTAVTPTVDHRAVRVRTHRRTSTAERQ